MATQEELQAQLEDQKAQLDDTLETVKVLNAKLESYEADSSTDKKVRDEALKDLADANARLEGEKKQLTIKTSRLEVQQKYPAVDPILLTATTPEEMEKQAIKVQEILKANEEAVAKRILGANYKGFAPGGGGGDAGDPARIDAEIAEAQKKGDVISVIKGTIKRFAQKVGA